MKCQLKALEYGNLDLAESLKEFHDQKVYDEGGENAIDEIEINRLVEEMLENELNGNSSYFNDYRYKYIVVCQWGGVSDEPPSVIGMEGAMASVSHSDFICPIGKGSVETMSHYIFRCEKKGRKWVITHWLDSCPIEIFSKVTMSHTHKNPSRSLHLGSGQRWDTDRQTT